MDEVTVLQMAPYGLNQFILVELSHAGRIFKLSFSLTIRGRVKIAPPVFEVHNRNEHSLIDKNNLPRPVRDWVEEIKPTLLIALQGEGWGDE
jgi:hypothetical protein